MMILLVEAADFYTMTIQLLRSTCSASWYVSTLPHEAIVPVADIQLVPAMKLRHVVAWWP